MTLLIDCRTDWIPNEAYEKMMNDVALGALEEERFTTDCEISLSFVDNEEIRAINRQFRNIDKPTDVLSFPLLTFEDDVVGERNELGELMLGDIIISVERAREQAGAYGHSLEREIAFLTAHSMFHLLGYDHMTQEEEKIMFQKQERLLQRLNITR